MLRAAPRARRQRARRQRARRQRASRRALRLGVTGSGRAVAPSGGSNKVRPSDAPRSYPSRFARLCDPSRFARPCDESLAARSATSPRCTSSTLSEARSTRRTSTTLGWLRCSRASRWTGIAPRKAAGSSRRFGTTFRDTETSAGVCRVTGPKGSPRAWRVGGGAARQIDKDRAAAGGLSGGASGNVGGVLSPPRLCVLLTPRG